jgi:hypothetical protein
MRKKSMLTIDFYSDLFHSMINEFSREFV